jgi:hypothetical protein
MNDCIVWRRISSTWKAVNWSIRPSSPRVIHFERASYPFDRSIGAGGFVPNKGLASLAAPSKTLSFGGDVEAVSEFAGGCWVNEKPFGGVVVEFDS